MKTPSNSHDLRLVAEVELIYRSKVKAAERAKADSPARAAKIFRDYWNMDRIEFVEEFKVLLVNNSNKALGIIDVAKGGITATAVDVRIIFSAALKANATGIFLAHNHPSGNLEPSRADKAITDKIRKAGELLDIKLVDHLIITTDGHRSVCDY